jgi:tripartite-type tricarboxylate transporter receptor subunit TctC
LRGYEAVGFLGFMVPAGTPRAVIATVNRAVNRILQAPEIKNHIANNGLLAAGGTPDDFAAFLKGDKAKWSKVIAGGSIRAE